MRNHIGNGYGDKAWRKRKRVANDAFGLAANHPCHRRGEHEQSKQQQPNQQQTETAGQVGVGIHELRSLQAQRLFDATPRLACEQTIK